MGRIRHEREQSCKQVHVEHNSSGCLICVGVCFRNAMANMIPELEGTPLVPNQEQDKI